LACLPPLGTAGLPQDPAGTLLADIIGLFKVGGCLTLGRQAAQVFPTPSFSRRLSSVRSL
jgi:hypothetical protein